MRAGAGASMTGSCHTVPVKASAGPRRVGTDPIFLMSTSVPPMLVCSDHTDVGAAERKNQGDGEA
jgi:hypothetical protein